MLSRRRPRARRERRGLLRDAELRPDVHLDRARLRRGARLRRVRREGHREGPRAAPGRARPGPGTRRGRRDDLPAADGHRRAATSRTRVAKGAKVARRRPPRREGEGDLLRADRARRRRPHDGGDDRGDVRPDAADHEGRATPRRRIRLANDSPYGLGGSVFTQGPRARRAGRPARRGRRGLRQRRAASTTSALELPMGGGKASGLGSRHGAGGIRKYCQQQSILVSRNCSPSATMHMFPYNGEETRSSWARLLDVPLRPRQA